MHQHDIRSDEMKRIAEQIVEERLAAHDAEQERRKNADMEHASMHFWNTDGLLTFGIIALVSAYGICFLLKWLLPFVNSDTGSIAPDVVASIADWMIGQLNTMVVQSSAITLGIAAVYSAARASIALFAPRWTRTFLGPYAAASFTLIGILGSAAFWIAFPPDQMPLPVTALPSIFARALEQPILVTFCTAAAYAIVWSAMFGYYTHSIFIMTVYCFVINMSISTYSSFSQALVGAVPFLGSVLRFGVNTSFVVLNAMLLAHLFVLIAVCFTAKSIIDLAFCCTLERRALKPQGDGHAERPLSAVDRLLARLRLTQGHGIYIYSLAMLSVICAFTLGAHAYTLAAVLFLAAMLVYSRYRYENRPVKSSGAQRSLVSGICARVGIVRDHAVYICMLFLVAVICAAVFGAHAFTLLSVLALASCVICSHIIQKKKIGGMR